MSFHTLEDDRYKRMITGDLKDTAYQIVLSFAVGLLAFFSFCVLRPRWPTLYAARKRQTDQGQLLPELPKTLFGWIPVLWKINDEQILASAGLDTYVFLAFFKLATKFLVIVLFFAVLVIKPVHDTYDAPHSNVTEPDTSFSGAVNIWKEDSYYSADYLWMYLAFAYFFTGLLIYFITTESKRIIEVRQTYLGTQTTVTDRTIRLSRIPDYLQSEPKIKDFIEELEIGKVENVLLCRNWKELDDLMQERVDVLNRLERALVEYEHTQREERGLQRLPTSEPNGDTDSENASLLNTGNHHVRGDSRPQERIWYGRWNLSSKHVDAIDYYEEKLRRLDEQITDLRDKDDFPTMPLAFVTLDSVAACQMAVQAVLDSSPNQLLATSSPAPIDINWRNTYMPQNQHLIRFWIVAGIILVSTLFWSGALVPLATLIDLDRIKSISPSIAAFLSSHPLGKSLVQTQLPTLIVSGLSVVVPYFYSWLSYQQGYISYGDVELAIISRNFFFTFFNLFIVFTALGSVSLSWGSFGEEPLRQTADRLASSIQDLGPFYVNYIILQALGLFPLRLLEFGSVSLFPFELMMSKTPRDYAELRKPPVFSFGFYLPQTILIFLICIMYSVLRTSWQILVPGLAYFIIGHFIYKYQLLYAMDHTRHSTGQSWVIIVDRIIAGLVIFQVSVAGQLVLRSAVKRSVLVIPLIIMTLWFSVVYSKNYKPLMTYIALRSIRRAEQADMQSAARRYARETGGLITEDESREPGVRFINPNLVLTLEKPWIKGPNPRLSRQSSFDRIRQSEINS